MAEVRVSVIIPFFYQVDWLIEALDSVFNQSFTDFEVIVINDGSKEDLSSFLDKYQDRIVYRWKKNGGAASARNLGIDLAKGEYIAFLDSDDLWDSNKLEKQVKQMDETKAIWSHSYWAYFADNNPDNVIKTYGSKHQKNLFPGSLASVHIATPCVMIRNDFLKDRKQFRFNEEMKFGQDTYLWLLLSSEHNIQLVPEVLCKVRFRGDNTAKKARAHIQTRALIWKYLQNDPGNIFFRDGNLAGIRCIYRFCMLEHRFLSWLEKRSLTNKTIIELIAKLLYVTPYIGFKYYKRILK